MISTLDLLKQQFIDLSAQRDAALAQSATLRTQRDQIIANSEASLSAQIAPLDAQIAEIERPVADIAQQIALISQSLNGQTAQ